jgi:hypothetical protein
LLADEADGRRIAWVGICAERDADQGRMPGGTTGNGTAACSVGPGLVGPATLTMWLDQQAPTTGDVRDHA